MFARWQFYLMILMVCALPGWAGTLAPAVEDQLRGLDEDDLIKVLVVLQHQADIPTLDRNLHTSKAALPQRHRQVVESLRAAAAVSQTDLLADLSAKSAAGRVVGFVSHWLINAVVVTGTPAAVRDLAARPDVARIEPDLTVSLISPVAGIKYPPVFPDSAGVGLTPGLRAVNADRVWTELGIDGTGTIVGVMDTGVDGTHPALADRWRGNFAPAEECWLDVVDIGDPSFPVDRDPSGHGTHVMGTVTGLAPGDTIGVAPGARWIAANTIIGGIGLLDNAVLASLEFMTDPDGDPTTTADVPDVVQNSWGVSEAFHGYFDCDSRWWDAIDNCEAAGVVLLWAAGNEGPNSRSLRSPADRCTTPLNCFAIGATETAAPYPIADFSSRGPSNCGGPFEIKPEVVAPGRDILSARPGGGYQMHSGTSMATPHVAGVVALIRQANPDLDVTSVKEILMTTALDLGEAGEDNSYGHGFIDAFAAVSEALTNVGTVSGTVADQTTGQPLSGATIANANGWNSVQTDSDGQFSLTMLAGATSFEVSRFGYFDGGFSVTIIPGEITNQDVFLDPRPTATLSGQVFGPDDLPVAGASVWTLDIPVEPVMTDAAGYYELSLPNGPGVIYEMKSGAPGLGYDFKAVELVADRTLDFHLPEHFFEDFESGDFLSYTWTSGGNAVWVIDSETKYEGAFSARSGPIMNDQSSYLSLDYYVSTDSHLEFWSKVSSEYYYDDLRFYLDDVLVEVWSGERDWSQFRMLIPRGHHNFRWVYQRDVAFFEGQDAAWLDFIEFPTTGDELFPEVTLDVASVVAEVAAGDTLAVPFTISNTGDWTLDFQIEVGDLLNAKASVLGEPSDGPRKVPGDNPDAFGYQWRDSDDPGGPVFDWVDIVDDGSPAGSGDDEVLGPIPLGFPFPFYGATFASVNISTNGFLSVSATTPAPQNRSIPDPSLPNNLLAVFWDDLDSSAGGHIYYLQDPAHDRFIVQFEKVVRRGSPVPATFQAILHRDGTILYQYADVTETGSCTVGTENGVGGDGLQVLADLEGYLYDGLAIEFEPPVFMARVSPTEGRVAPGSSLPATVTFNSAGLEPGVHVAVMTVISNDPTEPELAVPLLLTVNPVSSAPDQAVVHTVRFVGAVPNPFNPTTNLMFTLPAEAEVELDLFDVAGRRVRSLLAGRLPAGPQTVPWNGRDESGRLVASGTYFARLTAGGVSSVKSVTLVR